MSSWDDGTKFLVGLEDVKSSGVGVVFNLIVVHEQEEAMQACNPSIYDWSIVILVHHKVESRAKRDSIEPNLGIHRTCT